MLSLCVPLVAIWGISCGSGSNNDQGTSFQALGWFTVLDDEVVPLTSLTLALFTDVPATSESTTGLGADGLFRLQLVGLLNRLQFQFIRLDRFDCTYDVQGADPSLVIPGDSISKTFLLGPTEVDPLDVPQPFNEFSGDGSDVVLPQAVFLSAPAVTSDIYAFLNNNKNLLPELPFTMTTTCTAVGITQSGDVLETNPASLDILFVETAECCTGTGAEGSGGFQVGTSTGGTFDSFGEENEGSGEGEILEPDTSVDDDEVSGGQTAVDGI